MLPLERTAKMAIPRQEKIKPFRFESFGARIEITGNSQDLIERAADVALVSLLGNVNEFKEGPVDQTLGLTRSDQGELALSQNGVELAAGGTDEAVFYKYFDTIVRVSVGEASADRVFIHAGVVGWKGKAIVLPADSYMGKSTLVAELVRQGAEYYSDDFAVFDADGLLQPFHRPVGMRDSKGQFRAYQVSIEELGGKYGHDPIPAGLVLFTRYKKFARWRPEIISAGQGVLELIQYALPMRRRSELTFTVLNKIARRAIIVSSLRGTAENFAKTLLNFVDNHVN